MNLLIIVQFLVLGFGIDTLRMASLNTPSSPNSFSSIIGALILGDFVVNAGWLAPKTILHMVFVAFANFTQPNYELGYAIRFMCVMLLVLTAVSPVWGSWLGIALMPIIMTSNRTVTNISYFYPLFPFNPHDLKMIFVQKRLCGKSSSRS